MYDKEDINSDVKRLCVIGTGYIGISTMAYFASEGIRCIGYDIDRNKVEAINNGIIPIPELKEWLGFGIGHLVDNEMIEAVSSFNDSRIRPHNIMAIMIAVPTEKGAEPWFDALEDVVKKIYDSGMKDHLVIIESTLAPGTTEEIVLPRLNNVVIAPRRDWFGDRSKTLRTLPRIVGGVNKDATDKAIELLSIVCNTLLSCSYKEAEMVKAVENAIRHVDITFANELALAFPDIDIKKVMHLASTKWNVGEFIPSAGCGGYCIPLAPRYIMNSSRHPEYLRLLRASLDTDNNQPFIIANEMLNAGCRHIGILGLCYKGDIKVDILSPTKKIVEYFKRFNADVKVHDPYYTPKEIKSILSVESFDFPDGLYQFDGIILITDHRMYKAITKLELLSKLDNCIKILNNTSLWNNIDFNSLGICHKYIGEAGWYSFK